MKEPNQNIIGLKHELITHKLLHCTSWVHVYKPRPSDRVIVGPVGVLNEEIQGGPVIILGLFWPKIEQ